MIPMIPTIPNSMPSVPLEVEHMLALPRLCPATSNPQPGSTLTLTYHAADKLLDVLQLDAVVAEYIGHREIRDIEYMVQHLAPRCADALGVPVVASAQITLDIGQTMRITARPQPLNPGRSLF